MNAHARLAEQESARINALATVAKLRHTARDEIERLLAFLDETDGYTTTELEPSVFASGHIGSDGGEDDLEYDDSELEPSLCGLEARYRAGMDLTDGEEEQDDEPSLGSLSSGGGSQTIWGQRAAGPIDAEDEHDGAEPENEDGDGDPDGEPSLGWLENRTSQCGGIGGSDDREQQDYLPLPRQPREASGVNVEMAFGGSSSVLTGLSEQQSDLLCERLPRYALSDRPIAGRLRVPR